MKKAVLYVFSGTGNTLLAANMIARELSALDCSARVERVRFPRPAPPDPNGYDLAGFGYPIHAFNPPQPYLRYVALLPAVKKPMPAFIFKTSGEPFALNRCSSHALWRRLSRRGFDVLSDTHLLMPYNIMFRYPDALVKQMYLHTGAMSRLIARRAAAGERDTLRWNVGALLVSWILRLEWLGARLNGPLCRADRKQCVRCGQCVRECPMGNIRLEGGDIRFGMRCAMCMACAMGCPHNAVRAGLLDAWKVNPSYAFKAILADPTIPDKYVTQDTRGYFRLFNGYYDRTYAELEARGICLPRPLCG